MNNKKIGYLGEKIAKFYLQINNFEILKINFLCKFGEIDIIAQKGEFIHFIEVKTRTNNLIEAREAVNYTKQEHILKTAEYYLYKNRIQNKKIQFDAIEVYILKEEQIKINYIKSIIEK